MKTILFAFLVLFVCTMTAFAGSAGFKDNGNGTVTDLTTNLMWQQCSDGLSGANCTGTAATITWDNAIAYCEGLSLGGFTDWRLPKIKELQSIIDLTKASGATINTTYFPGTIASSYYWSSTTYAPNTAGALVVAFIPGSTGSTSKPNPGYVRCVRGGQ